MTFDLYPYGVGQHAAPDHAAAMDPGRRRGAAQGAPRGPGHARPDPGRAGHPWPVVCRGGPVGRPASRPLRATRARSLGGPHAGRLHGRDRPRRDRRHLRPAPGRGPARQPGHARAAQGRHGPLLAAPGLDGRHGRRDDRGQASASDLRLVPADPRRVRARGPPDEPGGGGAQDDLGAGGAPGPRRSGPPARWPQGGRRGLRSRDRALAGDLRRSASLPAWASRTSSSTASSWSTMASTPGRCRVARSGGAA